MRRTQIYLDEDQAEALARRSSAQGVTASHLIREAIARYLDDDVDEVTELARQRAAVQAAAGSLPDLADGATYVDDLRAADREREDALEASWRSR